jgi:serine/threonine-protein kinase
MPVANGEVFAGYTIVRLIGTGGMGEVYLAQHPRLPRLDALKILPSKVSSDPGYRQRFEREADIAAPLRHPHIVTVYDRGEYNGQLWITMDFVEGADAAQLVRAHYPNGMPLPAVLEIVSAVADALDYAHEHHLLHRDVKPANVLITDPHLGERRVLLADFGVARAIDDASALTATNVTVGSVAYAAPEQLMGKTLDGHADQYALACTAFHLLTGRPPFVDSNTVVVIGNHLSSPPPRLESVRPDLHSIGNVLATAMAKEPAQRFASCSRFAAALRHAGGNPVDPAAYTQPAMSLPAPVGAERTRARNGADHSAGDISISRRTAMIAGGVVAVVVVGVVAFIGARLGQPDARSPSAPFPPSTSMVPTAQVPQPASPDTITQTAPPQTITPLPTPARPTTTPPVERRPAAPAGDLGLTTPISYPSCNGQGVVILGSAVIPRLYVTVIQGLLNKHPGARYLRTDRSCPSLRQVTAEGNPIYAAYRLGGFTRAAVCAAVRAAGGNSYGKWLDTTTDPSYIIPC